MNPEAGRDPTWGGFLGEFKVIEHLRHDALAGSLDLMRKSAFGMSPRGGASRKFRIELSRNE